MTTPFDLRTMALLLRQGARLDRLSRGALLVAAVWIVAALSTLHVPGASVVALVMASVIAGLVQAYFALRVAFDAGLLQMLAEAVAGSQSDPLPHAPGDVPPRASVSEAAATLLDDSLQFLGLLPASKASRDWSARWAGASRLLRLQGVWLAVQLIALLVAVGVAGCSPTFVREPPTGPIRSGAQPAAAIRTAPGTGMSVPRAMESNADGTLVSAL